MEVVSPLIGQEARTLVGLHLFHYGLSNCSQKVRIVLAEKGLAWTSHYVDLDKGEHATDGYLRINPNGVVPTLVHDGTIVIESSDVMEYLDEHFPDPPLRPADERERGRMRQWIARQESIQRPLEVLSCEFLSLVLGRGMNAHPSRSTVACGVRAVDEALAEVNRQLGGRTWIAGTAFSLADVAWMVDVHRFTLMRFPMDRYGDVRAWYRRVRRLTSFQQAVLAYEPATLRRHFFRRWLTGSHVGAAKWRNPRLLADA